MAKEIHHHIQGSASTRMKQLTIHGGNLLELPRNAVPRKLRRGTDAYPALGIHDFHLRAFAWSEDTEIADTAHWVLDERVAVDFSVFVLVVVHVKWTATVHPVSQLFLRVLGGLVPYWLWKVVCLMLATRGARTTPAARAARVEKRMVAYGWVGKIFRENCGWRGEWSERN